MRGADSPRQKIRGLDLMIAERDLTIDRMPISHECVFRFEQGGG
jgi:hypothetical protein